MKRVLLALFTFFLLGTNAFALSMNASVSANYDMSFEKIIKNKVLQLIKISKIFEMNDDVFYRNKYTPLYLLSAKDIYNVEPTTKQKIEKRDVPDTYNLSFNSTTQNNSNTIIFSPENTLTADFKEVKNTDLELISQYPDRIELQYKYALYLYSKNLYEDAIDILVKIKQKDSNFVLASYTLGNIYYDMGEYKKSIKANMDVIKKNPYCADAYFNIASALEKLHKINLALDFYNKCLSINSNDEQAQNAIKRLEQLSYLN